MFLSTSLTAKPQKCDFGKSHIEYLGHTIGSGTVAVPAHRLKSMSKFVQPVTNRDLCSFIGAISYY